MSNTPDDEKRRVESVGGTAASGPEGERGQKPLPEIDFSMFLMSLASSALLQLGEIVSPEQGHAAPNLPLAKQTIDILGMLDQKTRGNLDPEEAQLLSHLLYDLRFKFVNARRG